MVRVASIVLIGGAPTSAAFTAPLPASPWQCAHFCAKIGAPCAMVPLPGGKPLPSGYTWISHAARSPCVSGCPRLGPAAIAGALATSSAASLSVDMAHASIGIDRPARRAVVVLADEGGHWRDPRALAARGDNLGARRLHVARVVPGATLQHRRPAVPLPRDAKAGEALREHRLLQRRLGPAFAAVGRHHHLGDASIARIGDAGDFVEARPLHPVAD